MNRTAISLQSCPKNYTYDQDKACNPAETVARFHQRLRETGLDILQDIQRIDTGRLDIPVYFSICGSDALRVIGNKKQMGKGSTPEQAQASACMELAERFSFFSFLAEENNILIGDYAAMTALGYPLLPLETLLASVHDQHLAPELLDRLLQDLPMRWVWALELKDNRPVLLPFSWFYAINEFNGSSAGNTCEEAILQGISEVVERHVCAVITQDQLATPEIDPDSIEDPVARELLDKFQRQGIELYLNDFSLDMGIPTIAALAWDPATFPDNSEMVYTAGTAPDATKALIRALTEVAQLAGDFTTSANYLASGLPKPRHFDEVAHVLAGREQKIALSALPGCCDADMYQEIQLCAAALDRRGMKAFVVDIQHPELAIPAVYTIIPGAHFRERAMSGNAALFAAKLAASLLEGRELDNKLTEMRKLLPHAYYLCFYQGRSQYEQGDIVAALKHFTEALTLAPLAEDLPYLHAYRACCFRDLGQHEEAIAEAEDGLKHDPERADLHNILGVCYFKTACYDKAVEHFRHALRLNPASAIDHANLGLNLEMAGKVEEAITSYKTALAMDASIDFASVHLDALLKQKGKA